MRGANSFSARPLQFQQAQNLFSGSYFNACFVCRQHRSRFLVVIPFFMRGAPDTRALFIDGAPGNRPGVKSADLPFQLLSRFLPTDLRFCFHQFPCVAKALSGLHDRFWWCAPGQSFDTGQYGVGAGFRQFVMQGTAGFVFSNGQGDTMQHRSGVEPLIHLHDTNTRFGISGLDGALNGGCAAPAGKQGGMYIPAAVRRHVQNG